MAKQRKLTPEEQTIVRASFAPDEIAERNGISTSKLYELWNAGKGPKYSQIGHQRRVTVEQEAAWLRSLEVA